MSGLSPAPYQISFPPLEDYQAVRVFPLMERIAWLGAVLALLAVGSDPWASGAGPNLTMVVAVHGIGAGVAVIAALVTRARWRPGLRVGLVLALVTLMHTDMTVGILFVQRTPELVTGLLVFSFFCVLPLAPLLSWRVLLAVDAGLLVSSGVLLGTAFVLGELHPLQLATILQFQIPGQIFLTLFVLWIRQQATEAYLMARDDHVHLTLDALSQVLNRSTWLRRAEDRLNRDRDAGRSSVLIMADIDHFKKINDTWGHPVGDEVISAVAQVMLACTRDTDLVGRLGGEEFAVFLPATDPTTGHVVAERIRSGVETLALVCPVRVSLGVAVCGPGSQSFEDLIAEADRRLYEAKARGRNRVVSATESSAR